MVSVVIGDEFFVAGFLYGGFERGFVVKKEKDAIAKIEDIIRMGDAELIVVKKGIIEQSADYVASIKADARMPLIIELPGV